MSNLLLEAYFSSRGSRLPSGVVSGELGEAGDDEDIILSNLHAPNNRGRPVGCAWSLVCVLRHKAILLSPLRNA